MIYALTTIVLWIIFLLLRAKQTWRNYYPVFLFSALLGTLCDLFGVVFDQWAYYGPKVGGLSLWSDLGIAPAEGGLFIILFPKRKSWRLKILYLVAWSVLNAFFEWFFVWVGWIGYDKWNPLRATLFYLFFFGMVWLQEYWYNGTGRVRNE